MDFIGAIKSGFTNYVNFKGVAGRAEYWYWILFILLVNIVVTFIDSFDETGLVSSIVSLGVLLPSLAVLFRRLRDSGHSPLWFWASLVSGFVFVICLSVFLISLFAGGLSDLIMSNPDDISQETIMSWFADPTISTTFLLTLVTGLVAGVLNIVVSIVFCLQQTKTAEQGNKYVLPQNPMI